MTFQLLTAVNMTFMILLGMVAFLLEVQLLEILQYIPNIQLLSKALLKSISGLASAGIMFIIASASFISYFGVMFGEAFEYRTIWDTSTSLLLSTLGHFRFNKLVEDTGKTGIVMFMFYNLLTLFVFMNYMITILMNYVEVVADEMRMRNSDNVIYYMFRWLKSFFIKETNSKF